MARKRNNKAKGNYKSEKSDDPKVKDDANASKTDNKVLNSSSTAIPSAANDPEWYAQDPRLAADGASIPFNVPMGARLVTGPEDGNYHPLVKSDNVQTGKLSNNFNYRAVPGVCSVTLKPSFGFSVDKTSPINVAANALYTYVRYVNSGRKNYDPADLFMYAAAFGDIYSYVSWCIRLYNYAYMYSQRNWYIGRDLIAANGVNPTNIIDSLANFRYWINSIINKISSFCIPGNIYYFKRRVFLYSNYYIENPYGNIKDQLYQFVPEGFMCFDYDSERTAGMLRFVPIQKDGTLMTLNQLKSYFEGYLMAHITGDEDFGLMSGDILKAYGDNIIHIAQIPEEGGLLPVFDPYVLSQFKNAHGLWAGGMDEWIERSTGISTKSYTVGESSFGFGHLYQQSNGLLTCMEYISNDLGPRAYLSLDRIMTVENPEPGIGDVLEASRLIPYYAINDDDISLDGHTVAGCGTEIPVSVQIAYKPGAENTSLNRIYHYFDFGIHGVEYDDGDYEIMSAFAHFKYAPMLMAYHYTDDVDEDVVQDYTPVCNLESVAIITNEQVRRLHEIALLSLFYVPGVAKLVS